MYKIFAFFFVISFGIICCASSNHESLEHLVVSAVPFTQSQRLLQSVIDQAFVILEEQESQSSSCSFCNNDKSYARKTRERMALAHTVVNAIDAAKDEKTTYKTETISWCTKHYIRIKDLCDCLTYPEEDDADFVCTFDCGCGPVNTGCSADYCGEYEKRKMADRFLLLALFKAESGLNHVTNLPVAVSAEIER